MLEKVKEALRISGNAFDVEVADVIEAAVADLRLSGVAAVPEDIFSGVGYTPLITRAVILYAKVHFGYSEDAERYAKAYEHLKCLLCLAGDHIS